MKTQPQTQTEIACVENFFGRMLGCHVKIIEVNCTGKNGLEEPLWKYFQFITTNPDNTLSRFEVCTSSEGTGFDVLDPQYDYTED
jgi:hypothetical protein